MEARGQPWVFFLKYRPPLSWDKVTYWPGTHWVELAAGQWAPGIHPPVLPSPALGLLAWATLLFLMWTLKWELRSVCLQGKHFTNWAISLGPNLNFFKTLIKKMKSNGSFAISLTECQPGWKLTCFLKCCVEDAVSSWRALFEHQPLFCSLSYPEHLEQSMVYSRHPVGVPWLDESSSLAFRTPGRAWGDGSVHRAFVPS